MLILVDLLARKIMIIFYGQRNINSALRLAPILEQVHRWCIFQYVNNSGEVYLKRILLWTYSLRTDSSYKSNEREKSRLLFSPISISYQEFAHCWGLGHWLTHEGKRLIGMNFQKGCCCGGFCHRLLKMTQIC